MQSAAQQATFYCDEAGYTGENYLDAEQSIFVLGGWLVPSDRESGVREATQKVQPNASEAHSVSVLRRLPGRRRVATFLSQMTAAGALPLYVVAEKRYCICAKIVEAFIDPMYNDVVSEEPEWTEDTRRKQSAAEALTALPVEALSAFWVSYCDADAAGLRKAHSDIVSQLRLRRSSNLAHIISGAAPHLDAICTVTDRGGSGHEIPSTEALNMPTFVHILSLLEEVGRRFKTDILVVSDESKHLDRLLSETFQIFASARESRHSFPNGNVLWTGFRRILGFHTSTSHASTGLQSADLLVGSLRRVLTAAWQDAASDVELQDAIRPMLVLLGARDPQLASAVVSNKFLVKLRPLVTR